MDIALGFLKLIGIVFGLVAFGLTTKWAVKLEKIPIERLRINPGRRLSHLDIIIRAYLLAGLIPVLFFFIPWLILGLCDVALYFALVSIGTPISGTIAYCRYRLSTFRRLTSCEIRLDDNRNTRVFVLR